MDRLGLTLGGLPVSQAAEVAKKAEVKGFESVWVYETLGRDAISPLTAIALSTKRILLGTGLLSLFVRTPGLTTMTFATLDELSQGRMILGVGVSYPSALRQRHGINWDKPLAALRDYIAVFKGTLGNPSYSYDGEVVKIRDFKLGFAPRRSKIPVYIGAHNPKMLELAGEVADGVVLNLVTKDEMIFFLKHLEIGAKKAGRTLRDIDVASFFNICVTEDRTLMREELRKRLTWFALMPHIIGRLKRTRFSKDAARFEELVKAGKATEVPDFISDQLIDALCVAEPPSRIMKVVEEFRGLGVNLPILFPTPLRGDVKKGFDAALDMF